MTSRLRYIATLCLLIIVSGCAKANVYYPGNGSFNATTSGNQLEQVLVALSETVDKTEAMMVAETAVRESAVLAEEYQLVRPAVAHNLLIALGLKDRGLCYHWTEDLMKRLQALDLKSLRLYWGVAHRGSELREHNCVVVSAKEQGFSGSVAQFRKPLLGPGNPRRLPVEGVAPIRLVKQSQNCYFPRLWCQVSVFRCQIADDRSQTTENRNTLPFFFCHLFSARLPSTSSGPEHAAGSSSQAVLGLLYFPDT
jgi:hypothetical protein